MYSNSMYCIIIYFVFQFISLTHTQSSSKNDSLCARYYPTFGEPRPCECDDLPPNSVTLKCTNNLYVPQFSPQVHHNMIELESCLRDLDIGDKTFADLNINTLRFSHCNLAGLNQESFSKINHLERFIIENATISSLTTSNGLFQEVFNSDSFQTLKLLILKKVNYHQANKHGRKLNLELLLSQLKQLNRLELIHIHLDNYHYHNLASIGQNLTYFKLINTHQTHLLPIQHLKSLECLVLLHLPQVFHTQPLIPSIKQLKQLNFIDFRHNQLTDINGLQSHSIDQIDLGSNLIQTIDEYTFEHVPKLRTLNLNENPLQYIDKNAFCGVKNLERLQINKQKSYISPLDNCILTNYPTLEIAQGNHEKLQCNCQLLNIYQMQRREPKQINRLFRSIHDCIVTNDTLMQTNYYEQLKIHLNSPIYIHELEKYLSCSSNDQCDRLCQERRYKSTIPPIDNDKLNITLQKQAKSLSTSSYSFFSSILFLLLLAFLYL